MRSPVHKRNNPKHRAIGSPPAGVVLSEIADVVQYVGSPHHKDEPSFAGTMPQPIPGRSVCPRAVNRRQADIRRWLQLAILHGNVGGIWEGGGRFPRYVWHREGDTIFECRHIVNGHYKGYPLEPNETVRGLA